MDNEEWSIDQHDEATKSPLDNDGDDEEFDGEDAQPELISLNPGKPEFKWVSVDDIPVGPQLPNKDMLESVENFGVMQAVILFTNPKDGSYEIAGGSRIHMAALEQDIEEVPALVYPPDDWGFFSSARLTLNANRSPSPIAELDAVVALLASGLNEQDIAESTGLPVRIVQKRISLSGLRDELKLALQSNKITLGVAEATARLSSEQQSMLVQRYIDNGRLSARDIKDVILLTTPETERVTQTKMSIPEDWREATRKAATAAIQHDIPLDMLISLITAEYGKIDENATEEDAF